jgi:hypothetical protein
MMLLLESLVNRPVDNRLDESDPGGMSTQTVSASPDLADHVIGEILALMGRRRVSSAALGRMLDEPNYWVLRRLNRRVPMSLDDVQRIATALDVPTSDLTGGTRRYLSDPLAPRIVKTVSSPSQTVHTRPNRRADRPHSRRDMAEVRRAPATRVAR